MSVGDDRDGLGAIGTTIATIDPVRLAWEELSDLGNAERLKARAGGRLAHVHEWGWLAYDGVRWSAEDGQRLASLAAHQVARDMRGEIAAIGPAAVPDEQLEKTFGAWCVPEVRKTRLVELRKWAVSSGMAARTTAMLQQAAHLLDRPRDSFDKDPLTINTLSHTLRIRRVPVSSADPAAPARSPSRPPNSVTVPETGSGSGPMREYVWTVEPSAHDAGDMLTRATACDYDPAAECRVFRGHIETVLPDPEVRRHFQELLGYALAGKRTEQIMLIVQGRGSDGKSTAMDMFLEMMGSYGVSADVQTFIAGPQRSAADASPDLARLAGDTRFVLTAEPKRGQALDEGRVKQFTGGGKITARMLHGDPFEYTPRGLLVMECNSRVRISGDDDGIWRRIEMVLFPHQFKGDAIDKTMKDRIRPEFAGVLNWGLEGLLRLLERGRLDRPQAVIEALDDYRRSANPFGEWMAERVDTSDPVALSLSGALFDDYKQYCTDNGVGDRETMNATAFGRALGDRQILKGPKDGSGKIQRRGAKLRPKPVIDVWAEPADA